MLKARPRKRTIAGRTAKLPAPRRTGVAVLAAGDGQVRIGLLVGWDDRGPLVDFAGNSHGPMPARQVGTSRAARPAAVGVLPQEAVLIIDPRPKHSPVLLGLLRPIGDTDIGAGVEARVDGQRVEIEGRDEIVFRCGEASITLRRNGRVVIHGVEVETRAKGVNRIKGGSVAIN